MGEELFYKFGEQRGNESLRHFLAEMPPLFNKGGYAERSRPFPTVVMGILIKNAEK